MNDKLYLINNYIFFLSKGNLKDIPYTVKCIQNLFAERTNIQNIYMIQQINNKKRNNPVEVNCQKT